MFKDYLPYTEAEPVGVELPKTTVDVEVLDGLGLDRDSTNAEILEALCFQGLQDKRLEKKEYIDRLEYELKTFEELGFTDYILLNWDILGFCHKTGIPVGAGRGSAAGSLALFCVGVTNIDPIKFNLFFERFVSKTRAKKVKDSKGRELLVGSLLPDVDSDVAYEQRGDVIKYIEEKHKGKTAKILTFNTFSSKLCIREAAKYFNNATEQEANVVSDMIPKLHGTVFSLEVANRESEKFTEWCQKHPEAYQQALKLENLIKNTGVHPSGIAICSQPIHEVAPLQKTKDGDLVTGYDMKDVADLMVKFDILGLRTLTIAHSTCQKVGINLDDINPEDPFIYDALQDLKSPMGLFQISADTNYRVCRDVKPADLLELSDVVALARPASLQFIDDYVAQKQSPHKLGLHPELDDILAQSKNILLYQESMMFICSRVFGMTLEDAETLRRVIGKKKLDEIPAWEAKIYDAAEKQGLDKRVADYFWGVVKESGSYQFNFSHSTSYANLAAKTVYLKFKHPLEFFISILESAEFEPNPLETVSQVQAELSDFGIKLLPPDLLKSNLGFTIEENNIRYGLKSIKGVSTKSLESLVEFRGKEFANKYEVFLAAKECGINISVLAALIQSGAMDSCTDNRIRLVLEAQAFNLLTDREKRNFTKLGEKFDYDVLNCVAYVAEHKTIGDDNREVMSQKRFTTFKKNFEPYRELFKQNKKHHRFTYWWYETSLLGYSYSHKLKDCFEDQFGEMVSLREIPDLPTKSRFKAALQVKDFFVKTSQNGNKYMKITGQDDGGLYDFLFMDNSRENKLTDFLETRSINKEDVVVVSASRSEDISFVNHLTPIDTQVFLKLRDLK